MAIDNTDPFSVPVDSIVIMEPVMRVLPGRRTPRWVWRVTAAYIKYKSNGEIAKQNTTRDDFTTKSAATHHFKGFIGSVEARNAALGNKVDLSKVNFRGHRLKALFRDQTGSAIEAVYTPDGYMYERHIQSPDYLLGPRTSPMPRSPVNIAEGESDWGVIRTIPGDRALPYPGYKSVEDRNTITRSTKTMQGLIAMTHSNRIVLRVSDNPKFAMLKSPADPVPKGFVRVNGPAFLALIMFGRQHEWAGYKLFKNFPLVNTLPAEVGPQLAWDDLEALKTKTGPAEDGYPALIGSRRKPTKKAAPKAKPPRKTTPRKTTPSGDEPMVMVAFSSPLYKLLKASGSQTVVDVLPSRPGRRKLTEAQARAVAKQVKQIRKSDWSDLAPADRAKVLPNLEMLSKAGFDDDVSQAIAWIEDLGTKGKPGPKQGTTKRTPRKTPPMDKGDREAWVVRYEHQDDESDKIYILVSKVRSLDEAIRKAEDADFEEIGPYASTGEGHTLAFYRELVDRPNWRPEYKIVRGKVVYDAKGSPAPKKTEAEAEPPKTTPKVYGKPPKTQPEIEPIDETVVVEEEDDLFGDLDEVGGEEDLSNDFMNQLAQAMQAGDE